MNADQIRESYGAGLTSADNFESKLEVVEEIVANGNPLGLISALVYCHAGDKPLPDWLFASLITLLLELANEGTKAALPSRMSASRREAKQFLIDRVRYATLLHIRNLQGKGERSPVTRGLKKSVSEHFLKQVGVAPTNYGKSWADAYSNAAEVLDGTAYAGDEEAMKKAYGRFKSAREEDYRNAAYWVLLKEYLGIPQAPTAGVI